jgi:hypothetical protein
MRCTMIKKYYVLALASLVMIPVVTIAGAMASIAIDPEIAVRYGHYERDFRILNQIKSGLILRPLP